MMTVASKVTPKTELRSGANRRRPGGRDIPYRTLRSLAQVYTVLAPLVLGTMLIVGCVLLLGDAPWSAKLGTFVGMGVIAAIYYLVMKSIAQGIYVMFDVSANAKTVRELNEAIKDLSKDQAKLSASIQEVTQAVKNGRELKAPVVS